MAFHKGLLVLGAGENSLRLAPPLLIDEDQADFAVRTLDACFGSEKSLSRLKFRKGRLINTSGGLFYLCKTRVGMARGASCEYSEETEVRARISHRGALPRILNVACRCSGRSYRFAVAQSNYLEVNE